MRACSVTDLLRLVRAGNLLVAAAGVLAGGWVALGAIAVPRLLGFAAVAAVGFGAAGNALNDLRDVAADRVNRPGGERPVAAGRLRRETAHLVAAAGIFIGVAMAALVSGTALLVGIAALVVIAAYSPLLKPAGVAGNVAIAAVAGLPLWFGAFAVGRPAAYVPSHALRRTLSSPPLRSLYGSTVSSLANGNSCPNVWVICCEGWAKRWLNSPRRPPATCTSMPS